MVDAFLFPDFQLGRYWQNDVALIILFFGIQYDHLTSLLFNQIGQSEIRNSVADSENTPDEQEVSFLIQFIYRVITMMCLQAIFRAVHLINQVQCRYNANRLNLHSSLCTYLVSNF